MAPKVTPVPDDENVIRYIRRKHLRRNFDTEEIEGVLSDAFEPRPQDDGKLSVTWIEHFGGRKKSSLNKAIVAFRKSFGTVDEPIFAISDVNTARAVSAQAGRSIRVLHAKSGKNSGHAVISKFKQTDHEVFQALATLAFCELRDETAKPAGYLRASGQ